MPTIRRVERRDRAEWLRMRSSLWPASRDEHDVEIDAFLSDPAPTGIVLVAEVAERGDLSEGEEARLGGFLEARTREYAEGCSSSPVGYIEGWWVDEDLRRAGVGARLVAAAEDWARSRGLTEMASDSELANQRGQAAHRALGYEEVERVVCFRKPLLGDCSRTSA